MSKQYQNKAAREQIHCLEGRGFAHHWVIAPPDDGESFKVGRCSYCEKDAVCRVAWPERLNSRILADEQTAAEGELLNVL